MLEGQQPGAAGAVSPGDEPAGAAARRRAFRDPFTWVIALAVFGAYFTLSLTRLETLNPTSWDLGIYTEYVKQYAHLHAPVVDVRGAGFNLLGDHFQPIVALIAPFFLLHPSPATLLAAQAALAAVSVFPVVSAGFALLPGRPVSARAIGLAYGFAWGLQEMAYTDFHEIAFAVPLLAFSLSALIRGRWRAGVAWALPLVFVKEDQGFTVAAIGLLLLYHGLRRGLAGRGRMYAGVFLVAWGMAWSVLAITVIIPHFNPDHSYYYWKDGGAAGHGTPFSLNGLAGQAVAGWAEKLQTVVVLLLPTVFLALGSPVALVALPSIALRFISTNTAYWGTTWHYNATVMPILFLSAIEVMGRWNGSPGLARGGLARGGPRRVGLIRRGTARYGAAIMVAVAAAQSFWFPLSDLWHGSAYAGGARAAAARTAMARVPDGVTVATTLDLLAPLAARTDTFWLGNPGNPPPAYIVFDGLDSGYPVAAADAPRLIRLLFPHTAYRQVLDDDGVYVFRRG